MHLEEKTLSYTIIDGKAISAQIKEECRQQVLAYKEKGIEICLAVIQVGADPASSVYVNNKKKACEFCGMKSLSYELPEETTEEFKGINKKLYQSAWKSQFFSGLMMPIMGFVGNFGYVAVCVSGGKDSFALANTLVSASPGRANVPFTNGIISLAIFFCPLVPITSPTAISGTISYR